MRRQGPIIAAAAALAVGLLLFYQFYVGSTVPPGQRPLVHLNSSNLEALREDFNQAGRSVRLLVMLSPT